MRKTGRMIALGAMSGTSLDGVDVAVVETDGVEVFGFGESVYRPYTRSEQALLRAALGKWAGEVGVKEVAELVERAHAEAMAGFDGVDVVGFHGQTLAHDPANGRTHQAGSGAVLAQVLGRRVVWDFRSNDVAMGGQGAPLAPAYHFALARWIGATEPLVFLNLGGVGNVTWVNPAAARVEDAGAVVAFDTGPANAPLNDLMQQHMGQTYDKGGAQAMQGEVEASVLERFVEHGYFRKMPPKSLDRDAFVYLKEEVVGLSLSDAAATLTAVAAAGVMQAEEHFPQLPTRILVTGGGRKNPVMMQMIAAAMSCPVVPVEEVGLDGDMLEAQAFAYLAVRVLNGLPTSFPMTTGVAAAIGGGEISTPVQGA